MVAPIIDELSVEYKGKVNFYKVNTDEEQELGAVFGIKAFLRFYSFQKLDNQS
ncbi:MAG: thioredoxin [Ignavibacteriaceae bacterium]|nr:thioredoxin [Ignavibacteriaceae bacterium]